MSQSSCSSPVIERFSSHASAQSSFQPSPHAWSSRYWRVSSMWKRASRPHSTRRYSCMSMPSGTEERRSGMFSQYAWKAAARRARKSAGAGVSEPSSGTSSAQLFSVSWSSHTTSHGATACAAWRSGSVLYWAWRCR